VGLRVLKVKHCMLDEKSSFRYRSDEVIKWKKTCLDDRNESTLDAIMRNA